jgi:uncharacterized protein
VTLISRKTGAASLSSTKLALGVGTLVFLGGGIWLMALKTTPPTISSRPPVGSSFTPSPTPTLNPLQIPAIQSRSYPGGAITTTADLGDQGGYRDTVISYPSDNLTQFALLSTPDTAKPASGWPVIILLHGYEDPSLWRVAGPEYRSFIGAFTAAGYAVVKPDFQGNDKSAGKPVGGHFAPDYAYNTLNLIGSLKQNPLANPKRLGLFAHSMGGDVGMRTIVTSKDIVASVFAAGVVGSMYDIFYSWPGNPDLSDQPAALVQGARLTLIAKYGDPKANPTFWNSASALNYVSAVTGPVQINQDVGDTVVPKIFADHLYQALTSANKSVEYHMYPGDDHQFDANRAALIQNALKFYRAHL